MIDWGGGMGWLTWTQYILSDGVNFRSEPNLAPNNPANHPSLVSIQECNNMAHYNFIFSDGTSSGIPCEFNTEWTVDMPSNAVETGLEFIIYTCDGAFYSLDVK